MLNEATKILGQFEAQVDLLPKLQSQIKESKEEFELAVQTKAFLIQFSENSRDLIKKKLENVVNSALEFIFGDKKLFFMLMPKITKRGVVYELFVETNGAITPLENAKGGGVLDICSISLRVAFLRLFRNKLRQVMVLDEPFKNLDTERLVYAVQWMKSVSVKFGIQFIIISHENDIIQGSDKVYQFKLVGKDETIVS